MYWWRTVIVAVVVPDVFLGVIDVCCFVYITCNPRIIHRYQGGVSLTAYRTSALSLPAGSDC